VSPTGEPDRLIFLAEALELVPFSETTLRRAINGGDLEAWQPNRDGKLVMWRSALVEWATRRPAVDRLAGSDGRTRGTSPGPARRTRGAARTPEPISLPDLA
jgi:hypothetical protein